MTLDGTVEVAYFGGHVRPENRKEDRKDRRLSANRDADRRVVVVLRQRGGRTLPFVVRREADGAAIVRGRVAPGASCTPTKRRIGIASNSFTTRTGSTILRRSARTARAPIKRKAICPVCAAPSLGSTTTFHTAISISMRMRPHGTRTTPGRQQGPAHCGSRRGTGVAGQPPVEGLLAAGGLNHERQDWRRKDGAT